MARLTLNPKISLQELGQQVLIAASSEHSGKSNDRDDAENAIKGMFANDGGFVPDNPDIEFHYDTKDKVHIAIPYIGDKVVDRGSFLPEFDFDKLATEALGFIVIFGCAK